MAILQSALVEPLLSRSQTAVIRDIARVTQLNEALKGLILIKQSFDSNQLAKPTVTSILAIEEYLRAEIIRVLMQIKTPAIAAGNSNESTKAPGNVPGISHTP